MPAALIIGSGPASAAAALALSRREDLQITIIDLGLELEPDRRALVDILSTSSPASWDPEVVKRVAEQPVGNSSGGLPQKRTYGSDFPFRNIGQVEGIKADGGANTDLVSAAYGGFSNVWGAQVMPFSAAAFGAWPVRVDEMEGHYRQILDEIPFAAEDDDLARLFPLIGTPAPLPPVSARTDRVLAAYARHRAAVNNLGLTIGKARLAFRAGECVSCGLCMTGCPYTLIYSASQTMDQLRRSNRVTYHGGLLALEVGERGDRATVIARELRSGQMQRFEADRIYLACGGIGTTRVVLNSLRLFDRELTMAESQQFALPFLSFRSVPDPRLEAQFTLNQFNLTIALDEVGRDLSQLHFYTYNPAFADAMPRFLRVRLAEPVRRELLRRLSFALGYLPSWMAPALSVHVRRPSGEGLLPELRVAEARAPAERAPMLRAVTAKLLRAARLLDLYPVLPMLRLAAAGKSYHWGGSFPHAADRPTLFHTDRMGRLDVWSRIHLVDASVFPTVPATTFTLTVMANAHRIASETLGLPR